MLEFRETSACTAWFTALLGRVAKARIAIRIKRLSIGNLGDVRHADRGIPALDDVGQG
jgi:putative component of toxin-antitoxin plasmid stabilization module